MNSPFGKRVFSKGESIHTENSHKYSPESFKNLLLGSGYVDIYDFLHLAIGTVFSLLNETSSPET